ncbi:RNA polymerase II elongation factor ELL2-like [Sorex fumeus]|uniref:RNA polymerase II elongation factor ELL2-like n=1 Tax=Sorex fumeus TaxID=62283 RepID=UPI0024ACD955|nr:RNA polymerase II elongation factor ELL2-like [Sorex fumeus]
MFTKVFSCLNLDPYRYHFMENSEEMDQMLYQDGQVEMEAANGMGPYQDSFSVLPMNPTGEVSQPIDYYGNLENRLCPQASHQFQGHTGPIQQPPINPPTQECNFNLQNSSDSILRYSSEYSHLYHRSQNAPYYGPSESSCLPLMSETPMVCGKNDTYQNTDIKAQEEEVPYKQQKNIRKTRAPTWKDSQSIIDIVPERKKTTPMNPAYAIRKSRITNSVYKWPFRDRIIHLLALKNYRKTDLLVRLQKDGIPENDKNTLGRILQEVAILNTDFSYSLKDSVFKEIRKDWPGYNNLDRQSLELILANKAESFQKSSSNTQPQFSSRDGTLSFSQDQSSNPGFIDPLRRRKVRISHLATASRPTLNRENSTLIRPPPSATTVSSVASPELTATIPISNSMPVASSSASNGTAQGLGTQHHTFRQKSRISESQVKTTNLKMLASSSFAAKKRKSVRNPCLRSINKFKRMFLKYRVKNRMCSTTTMKKEKTETKPQREDTEMNPAEEAPTACSASATAPALPDYLTKYVTVDSPEQREHFVQDFYAEYDEYQTLHAKMVDLSRIFFQLDAERNQLTPGSKEYQDIDEKVILEYQKMIELNPNFKEEKRRCLYLYDKLSHIKRLVSEYDQQNLMETSSSSSGSCSPE